MCNRSLSLGLGWVLPFPFNLAKASWPAPDAIETIEWLPASLKGSGLGQGHSSTSLVIVCPRSRPDPAITDPAITFLIDGP